MDELDLALAELFDQSVLSPGKAPKPPKPPKPPQPKRRAPTKTGVIARPYLAPFREITPNSQIVRDLAARHPEPPRVGPDLVYLAQNRDFIDQIAERRLHTLEQLIAAQNQTLAISAILCSIISADVYPSWAFVGIHPETINV